MMKQRWQFVTLTADLGVRKMYNLWIKMESVNREEITVQAKMTAAISNGQSASGTYGPDRENEAWQKERYIFCFYFVSAFC